MEGPWRGKPGMPGEEKKPNPMGFRQTDFNELGKLPRNRGLRES